MATAAFEIEEAPYDGAQIALGSAAREFIGTDEGLGEDGFRVETTDRVIAIEGGKRGGTDFNELRSYIITKLLWDADWREYGLSRIDEWVSAETTHRALLKGKWRGTEFYEHWTDEGPEEF